MKIKKTIQKALVLTAWSLVGCGMFVLLAAAKRKQQHHYCRQVSVTIKGDKTYIDKGDIVKVLSSEAKGSLIHKPVTQFDLSQLEKKLESQAWIRDAELYFDSKDVLHVFVWEREPIARVFTTSGSTFYLDSSGKRLPLLNKVSARVPVITNFIAAKRLNAADSVLLNEVKELLQFITADDFWKVQIAQIDITPAHNFELIPVVGNHLIKLGTADNYKEKLQRLFVFYQQVLSKTGFDKYSVIDLRYDGQVVASQKGDYTTIDSVQLQKNIKELLAKTRLQAINDSVSFVQKIEAVKMDSIAKAVSLTNKAILENNVSEAKIKPVRVVSKTAVKVATKKASEKTGKPKAVMKNNNEY
ncbi:MAG: cell division protein FtsQ/DivIB [Chitinophagaceae bacterium]